MGGGTRGKSNQVYRPKHFGKGNVIMTMPFKNLIFSYMLYIACNNSTWDRGTYKYGFIGPVHAVNSPLHANLCFPR